MNRLNQRLLSLFNVYPGEGRLVLWVLTYAILLYTANVLVRTASYALFLTAYDAQTLSMAYVGIAVFAPLVSAIYLRLNQRYALSSVLLGVHGFLLLTLVGYRAGLGLTAAPWLLFSLPIYFGVNNSLTISSFWNLLGRIYNLQQGKRLFGLLSSGEQVATIAAGFIAPFLIAWLGTPNLFLVGALAMAATLGVLIYILRANADKMKVTAERSVGRAPRQGGSLLKDHYIRLIISLFGLFVVGVYFVDNIFYSQATGRYPTEDELGSFIGVFFGIVGVVSLLIQFFVAGRLLTRFGVKAMILATPIGLVLCMVPFALIGTLDERAVLLFWLVAAANLYRLVLDAVDNAAVNIMYQPLPAQQRTQAQTAVMGIVYPLAIGVTGAILLFLYDILHFEPVQVAYVLLLILAAWLTTGVLLGQAYPRRLQQALRQRTFSGISVLQPDRSSLAVFQQGLASPHVGVVVYSLDMLGEITPETVPAALTGLLEHTAPEVRQEALRRIERLGLTGNLPAVQGRLHQETSPSVRATALHTLAALGQAEVVEQVYPYLEDPDPQLRREALAGLLHNVGVEVTALAENRLAQMAESAQPAERTLAARVIGEAGRPDLQALLGPLLQDQDLEVHRAALTAAGQAGYAQLWPLVVAGLSTRETRRGAAAALVTGGQAALPAIEAAFGQPDQDREVSMALARVCGRTGGDRAQSLLRQHMQHPDGGVRAGVLAALSQCGFQAGEQEQAATREQIRAEVAQASATLAASADIGTGEAASLLVGALDSKLTQHQANIFCLLSFMVNAQAVLRAWDILRPAARIPEEQRAYALETLEVLLPKDLKGMLWPLLGEFPPAERLKRLSAQFPQASLSRPERLREMIAGPRETQDDWIQACAIHTAGLLALPDDELVQAMISAAWADGRHPLLAETAAWALTRLDGPALDRCLAELKRDPDPSLAGLIQQIEQARSGQQPTLSTMEKVAVLRKVGIFAETPDESLVDVARLLAEIRLDAGETVFEKGDRGDSMYIVVGGQVRVHDRQHTLSRLGPGDVFGEMALLDPEPRMASVSTLEDTRLLRLDRELFYELVEDRIEVPRGIIRVLSRRLRTVVRDLGELSEVTYR